VELTVSPPVDDPTERALNTALRAIEVDTPRVRAYDDAWRRAALHEGVEGDDAEVGYVPSPRSTRGATRA
jgi:hypothetical protein